MERTDLWPNSLYTVLCPRCDTRMGPFKGALLKDHTRASATTNCPDCEATVPVLPNTTLHAK